MTEEQFIEFSKLNPKAAEDYLATRSHSGYELIPDWKLPDGEMQVIQYPTFLSPGKIKMHPLRMVQFCCYISDYDDASFEMAKKILHEFVDRSHTRIIDIYNQTGMMVWQN